MEKVEKTLKKLGLNQSEIKVYCALLALGSSLAGTITKHAQINRSHCYDALERLSEKGLVSYVIKENRKYFHLETPQKLLELAREEKQRAEEKEKEVKNLLPSLTSQFTSLQEKPEAAIYRGKRGIKSIFEDILRHKEYFAFGSSGKFKEIMDPFFTHFQNAVIRKKIRCKLLVSEKTRGKSIIEHAERRFLPEEYLTLISTLVYGNKVAVISWSDDPVGFVIEDPKVADSYRSYFTVMWKQAKK